MTVATKSIKITERAHYQLRIMAAKNREKIWALVDQAVVLLGRANAAKPKRRSKTGVKG